MTNWEYVQIDIPKELYDKISRFSDVEEAILQDMSEWVKIMEDEERLAEVESSKIRFQVETHFDEIFPYVIISSTKKKDQCNDFVGKMDLPSKKAVIKVARDGWGISEEEIEFVN